MVVEPLDVARPEVHVEAEARVEREALHRFHRLLLLFRQAAPELALPVLDLLAVEPAGKPPLIPGEHRDAGPRHLVGGSRRSLARKVDAEAGRQRVHQMRRGRENLVVDRARRRDQAFAALLRRMHAKQADNVRRVAVRADFGVGRVAAHIVVGVVEATVEHLADQRPGRVLGDRPPHMLGEAPIDIPQPRRVEFQPVEAAHHHEAAPVLQFVHHVLQAGPEHRQGKVRPAETGRAETPGQRGADLLQLRVREGPYPVVAPFHVLAPPDARVVERFSERHARLSSTTPASSRASISFPASPASASRARECSPRCGAGAEGAGVSPSKA